MISNKAAFKYVISARDDYARDDKDQDCLLLNPNWKVKPSISFVNGIGEFFYIIQTTIR